MAKKTSYKDKTEQELVKALNEKREALRDMRFGAAGTKAKNARDPRDAKKDIARILTELNKTGKTDKVVSSKK